MKSFLHTEFDVNLTENKIFTKIGQSFSSLRMAEFEELDMPFRRPTEV